MRRPSSLLRILRFMAGYPWRVIAGLSLATAGTLLGFVFPGVTQWFLDDIVPGGDTSRIAPAALFALGAMGLRQVFYALRTVTNNAFELRMTYDLRSRLHDRVQHLPLGWFDRQSTGDILMRMANDVPATQRVILDGVDQIAPALLQIVLTIAFMLHVHVKLALVTIVPVPLIAAGGLLYARWVEPRASSARDSAGTLNSLLHDNIAGIRQTKAYTLEPEKQLAFNRVSSEYRLRQTRLQHAWAVYGPVMGFFGDIGLILLMGFGSYWCITKEITVGQLVQYLMLLAMLYEPIGRLHGLSATFVASLVAAPRVFEILDMTDIEDLHAGRVVSAVEGEIRFENVSFGYDENRPVLKGIDLLVPAHQTVAIVGATGTGKTTLFQLLTRLYDTTGGEIYLDGIPIREFSKASLRDAIGYVTQESHLFNLSVRDNLQLGKADAADEEIWASLRHACADEFVERLDGKLDARVGERGGRLSGGEKQRIAIARAFLKDAPILLLDEATSAVDTRSERLIQKALDELRRDRTCLVIAHRLTTIQNADHIYVMRYGEVVAHGTHGDLLKSSEYYAELTASNFDEALAPAA